MLKKTKKVLLIKTVGTLDNLTAAWIFSVITAFRSSSWKELIISLVLAILSIATSIRITLLIGK